MSVLIITAVVLLFLFGRKKKPKATAPYTPIKPYKPLQAPVIRPNQAALDLAGKHFGKEWREYLIERQRNLNISNPTIIEKMATCYSSMPQKDLEGVLLSFIHVVTDSGGNSLQVAVRSDNYKELHEGVCNLITGKRFTEMEITNLLKQLAAAYRELKKDITKKQEQVNKTAMADPIGEAELSGHSTAISEDVIDIAQIVTRQDTHIPTSAEYTRLEPANYPVYDPDEFKLGKRYKEKLNLSTQEVSWLNKFDCYHNVFNGIVGCEIEIIKLYLLAIKSINKRLKKEESSLAKEIEPIKEKAFDSAATQPGYWSGYDYSYLKKATEAEVYHTIYKKAEALIRETWGHKRKITADFQSSSPYVKVLFQAKLGPLFDEVIAYLQPTIGQPDEQTELELNAATTTRWREKFETITATYKKEIHIEAVQSLYTLGRLNLRNPAVENVYYEAAKFIASYDKLESLRFYLHYVYYDLKSVKVDQKQLNKTIQRRLFANETQLSEFLSIVDQLVQSQNLESALQQVAGIYQPKRKKIELDRQQIQLVEQQHSGTVEVLNEYLQDETDETNLMDTIMTESEEEVIVVAAPALQGVSSEPAVQAATFLNPVQTEFLVLFRDDYQLAAQEVESYARSKGMFKNQLLDSINEACYEVLDDVLIEEGDEIYTINPDYYSQILA